MVFWIRVERKVERSPVHQERRRDRESEQFLPPPHRGWDPKGFCKKHAGVRPNDDGPMTLEALETVPFVDDFAVHVYCVFPRLAIFFFMFLQIGVFLSFGALRKHMAAQFSLIVAATRFVSPQNSEPPCLALRCADFENLGFSPKGFEGVEPDFGPLADQIGQGMALCRGDQSSCVTAVLLSQAASVLNSAAQSALAMADGCLAVYQPKPKEKKDEDAMSDTSAGDEQKEIEASARVYRGLFFRCE